MLKLKKEQLKLKKW